VARQVRTTSGPVHLLVNRHWGEAEPTGRTRRKGHSRSRTKWRQPHALSSMDTPKTGSMTTLILGHLLASP
jgi:hypothetical protein